MLRLLQVIVGTFALLTDFVAVGFFFDWARKTDWLMGHVYGPASSILTATWSAGASILCVGVWLLIKYVRRREVTDRVQPTSGVWLSLIFGVLGLFQFVVIVIFAIGILELPHARSQLATQHIKAGNASVAELIEGLQSSDFSLRFWSVTELERLGPEATPAVPALADALSDSTIAGQAADALGNIGPQAQAAIPALVEAIEREQGKTSKSGSDGPSVLSWQAGMALARIGPASIPELSKLLAHEDRNVRRTAAGALREIGPEAEDAIEALKEAVKEQDESVKQSVRAAIDPIGTRRHNDADEHADSVDPSSERESESAQWITQPSFSGNARNRPPRTIALRFSDGYQWPVRGGSLIRWDTRLEGDRHVEIAITANGHYEHILGTDQVRIIESRSSTQKKGAAIRDRESDSSLSEATAP